MNWTTETPTNAGDYAWKIRPEDSHTATTLNAQEGHLWSHAHRAWAHHVLGLWCRLVPADETVPKEEVEAAYNEGWSDCISEGGGVTESWNDSRAKRVMEGIKP